MKKCTSCTKDLPDAALHCVFCGAKQPPAPAVQQGMVKTAFGYQSNEVIDQLRQAQAQARAQQPAPYQPPQQYQPPPQQPPYQPPPQQPPRIRPGPTPSATGPTFPAPPPPSFPAPQPPAPPNNYVPQAAANAKTMFVQNMPPAPAPPQQPYARHPPTPMAPPQAMAATMVPQQLPQMSAPMPPAPQFVPMPQMPAPMAIPAAQPPPYLASQTASRAGRPMEPWRDSLRLMMFLWGVALLAAFATPIATKPDLAFNWTLIMHGEGTAKLQPLMLAAIGLLSLIVAAIPMQPAARGLISAVLGLAGIAVPIALVGLPPWQLLVPMVGVLLLVPSLFLRNEYRDAALPRLLITIGAVGVLLPFLLPQQGAIPLVSIFKELIDLPGAQKVHPALALAEVILVVMTLLSWLPAPISAAASLWAWLLILWSLVGHVALLLLGGNLGDAITASPNLALTEWIFGGPVPGSLGSAYLVLIGYGLASLVGKQLE